MHLGKKPFAVAVKPNLHFHFITLFPDTIPIWLTTSILGRAKQAGLFDFHVYQLRDYSTDKHKSVDDAAYGGGGGMVLRIEPLVNAVETIKATLPKTRITTICLSPTGKKLNQGVLDDLQPYTGPHHLILVCGHYEGIDQRFIDGWVDQEVSIGDFILTGGELPALALADALIRQQRGALGQERGSETESFRLSHEMGGSLLEYPHYTRPVAFRGFKVPDVLLSGNHARIGEWRDRQSRLRTACERPDLLQKGCGDPHRVEKYHG